MHCIAAQRSAVLYVSAALQYRVHIDSGGGVRVVSCVLRVEMQILYELYCK